MVTDYTIFNDHKRFSQANDANKVMFHMRAYLAHLFNGIAQRYLNSADQDLRINIKLSNFLFLNTEAESVWSSPALYGIPGVPTYEGREVVNSKSVLDAFKDYISALTLSFNYDHAIGFFK